jgi:integrase/recombinase XerD
MEHLIELFAQTLAAKGHSRITIRIYVGCLKRFAGFIGKPLEDVVVGDLQAYQRYLANDRRLDYSSRNVVFCALKSFFQQCLEREWDFKTIPFPKKARKLPEILDPHEVSALLDACPNLKHRALLMTSYGCGLRVSEVLALRPEHIDSKRMVIRVEQGKGRKDRYVMLPEQLLLTLRDYWRAYRPTTWVFEGQTKGHALSDGAVRAVFQKARHQAGITKAVSFHSLRHAFATHLLEGGTNVRIIQVLLGHRSLTSTQIYTHVARTVLNDTRSPLDLLKPKEEEPPEG